MEFISQILKNRQNLSGSLQSRSARSGAQVRASKPGHAAPPAVAVGRSGPFRDNFSFRSPIHGYGNGPGWKVEVEDEDGG